MLASASAAAVSWGDETTVAGMVTHLLRRDYGTFGMGEATDGAFVDGGTLWPNLLLMWGDAFPRCLWVGPLLGAMGIVFGLRNRRTRPVASVLLFVFAFYGLTFCDLANVSPLSPIRGTLVGRFCVQSDLLCGGRLRARLCRAAATAGTP